MNRCVVMYMCRTERAPFEGMSTCTTGILLNPLTLRAAKTGLTILLIFFTKVFFSKIFEGEMFIRILPTTLLQIFCENLLYFQYIFKSMKIADDTFLGNSECAWVNLQMTE